MKFKILVCSCLITLVTSFSPIAQSQTFSVIHSFGATGDGQPAAGVTLRAGTLYGTTVLGGNGNGTVYQITHVGSSWITTPISFLPTGTYPASVVTFGPDGHPYATNRKRRIRERWHSL